MTTPDAMEHAQGPFDRVNLVLRFLLELVMFVGLAWAAAALVPGRWPSIAAAVLAPVVAIVLWGALIAPGSGRRLAEPARLVVELALFAATGGVVAAANLNAPEQTVISGAAAAVELASVKCKERGAKRAIPLKVSAPFHCALMQRAQDRLAKDLEATAFHEPKLSVVSNVDASWVATSNGARDALTRQVTGAVRWVECEQQLIAADVTHFVEVGPGKVLSGLMRPLDSSRICLNVENVASLDKTLAALENKSA